MTKQSPLLEMRDIHKSYGEIKALRGVNLTLNYNEIVGLIGDNGAGKSTLMKVLGGFIQPDKGEIYLRGEKVKIRSPREAQRLGIETLYQDQALVLSMDIARNIFLGREPTNRLGFLKMKEMRETSAQLLRKLGLQLNPTREVQHLSGGQRQGVAMARALHFTAKIFTLDEPTAGLSFKECENVLKFTQNLKKEGASVIFVTHNLFHVFPVADRFVILSLGKVIRDIKKEETYHKQYRCFCSIRRTTDCAFYYEHEK